MARSQRLVAAVLLLGLLLSGPALAQSLNIVALGDSLTAGLGLAEADAYPPRLAAALKTRGLDVAIANAGVSGDTAADGLNRLDWSVPDGTHAVLIELGANDMLRGMAPAGVRAALTTIIERLQARKIRVMLLGMRAAPNLGHAYREEFDTIYPDLARRYGVTLYPFFLDGVAGDLSLNQSDAIHPTAKGVEVIVGRIAAPVEAFIREK